MTRRERLGFWMALSAAAATGLAFGLVRWFGARMGEFGPEPHPWQGTLQHLHVLVVPLLVFALGWLVRGHALKHLPGRRRRASGLGLLALAVPMVLGGYAIQVSTAPAAQTAFRWVHGLGAGCFVLAATAHVLWKRRR